MNMRSMRVYRQKHDKCGRPARPHTQTGSGAPPFQDWHVDESSKLYRATINPSQDGVQTLGSVVVGVKFYAHTLRRTQPKKETDEKRVGTSMGWLLDKNGSFTLD
jgi:hypothetical protein